MGPCSESASQTPLALATRISNAPEQTNAKDGEIFVRSSSFVLIGNARFYSVPAVTQESSTTDLERFFNACERVACVPRRSLLSKGNQYSRRLTDSAL